MTKQWRIMNNLMVVKNTNGKWGAFNKELEIVLPFEYDSIYSKIKMGEEIFYYVKKDGVPGFVSAKNTDEFIRKDKSWTGDLAYNLIKEKNGKYGITDLRGNFTILPIYDEIEVLDASESYNYYDVGQEEKMLPERFLLYKDDKIGLADFSNVLCPPEYSEIYAVSDSYKERLQHVFLISKDGLSGYVNANGKIICDIKYDEVNYPCTSILTYAEYGNTMDIINLEQEKVIYSCEKASIEYINIDYKHCCIANKLENRVYVLDSEGTIITKFEIPKDIKDYQICYVNEKFLGYKKPIHNKMRNSFGLINYAGKILTPPKYSNVTPIKGTSTVVTNSLFSRESELLDENCNVIRNGFISLGSFEYDDEFGIIPPLIYERLNVDDTTMYYTDKNINFDEDEWTCSDENKNVIDIFCKKDDIVSDIINCIEEDGKTYIYCVPERENKIFVYNEDKSIYRSIEFNVSSEEEELEFYDLW